MDPIVIFDEGYQLASVTDLRHNAAKFVKEAEHGQDTVIFKHNKPVAVLIGLQRFQELTNDVTR